jgi:hypothetical protein
MADSLRVNTVTITYAFEDDDQSVSFLNALVGFLDDSAVHVLEFTVEKSHELVDVPVSPPPEVNEISRVELKPGDVVIVKCAMPLSESLYKSVREHLNAIFPGHPAFVIPADWEIQIVEVPVEVE